MNVLSGANLLFFAVVLSLAAFGIQKWLVYFNSKSTLELKTHPSPFGLFDVLLFFIAWIVAPGLGVFGLMSIWGETATDSLSSNQMTWLLSVTTVLQLLVCAIAAVVLSHRYGSFERIFGVNLSGRQIGSQSWLAFEAFVMVVPGLLGLQWLLSLIVPYGHSTIDQLYEDFSLPTILATWFGAVIAAPICEELFFRGVLQSWLQRLRFDSSSAHRGFRDIVGGWENDPEDPSNEANGEHGRNVENPIEFDTDNPYAVTGSESLEVGKTLNGQDDAKEVVTNQQPISLIGWWFPIAVSSGLFAAVHIGQGLAPIPLFIFGLALGFLYRQTGSIVPSIVLHFLLNCFSMFWVTFELALRSIE